MDVKGTATSGFTIIESDSDLSRKLDMNDPDQAYNFLKSANASKNAAEQVDLKKLRRKVDWYIVPVMFLCYTMQFIDKVSLNVSFTLREASRTRANTQEVCSCHGVAKGTQAQRQRFYQRRNSIFHRISCR